MDKAAQFAEAAARAKVLRHRLDAREISRRLAAEFDICVYAVRGSVFGSFYQTDKTEVIKLINQ